MSINRFPDVWNDLAPLLRPRSVAIVGASPKEGSTGMQVIRNLEQLGFSGRLFPINPKYDEIAGYRCYPSLTAVRDAGEQIDEAAVLLGRSSVLPTLREAAEAGVKAVWSFASGMGEMGEEGKRLQQEIVDFCREHRMLFLGPNCVGYMNPAGHAGTYSAPMPTELRRGNIGVVAQSGYVSIAISNAARGLGFSLLVSCGNEAVVNSTDVMEYMLADPDTKVIMAFIEQFRDPEKLVEVARRAHEVGKPILLIKVGRSQIAQRAAVAHTGALAGSDAVQNAIFEKYGVIRVDDLDELYETAALFSALGGRLPKGRRAFATTLSGGIISLLGDVNDGVGLVFPPWSPEGKARAEELLGGFVNVNNPLDAWGSGHIEQFYEECLLTAAREESADMLLVIQDVPPGMSDPQVRQYSIVANAAANAAARTDKPVIWINNAATGVHPAIAAILDRAGVPVLRGTRAGLRAAAHASDFASFVPDRAEPAPSDPDALAALDALAPGGLTEYESKSVLRRFGIPCAREILCHSPEECAAAAASIGYPVALKVMSREILHKTEAGALKIGIPDEPALLRAYGEVLQNAEAYHSGCKIDGVLVQQMAPKAVAEMIVGITSDPAFGLAVVLGTGGVAAEVLRDSAIAIPPFSRDRALALIRSIRGYALLDGFRGAPRADIGALADILVRLGDLAAAGRDRIRALDVNPLLLYPEGQGALAVDALLEIRESTAGGSKARHT